MKTLHEYLEIIESLEKNIAEAIPLGQAMKYRRAWNPQLYKNIFMQYPADQRDKNAYRIYLPYQEEKKHFYIPAEIKQELDKLGYEVTDYGAGLAKEKTGKRVMKIGRLLADAPELQKKFINDPQRAISKTNQKLVVISRHPYDIAGMSTGRGWRSCMHLTDGVNKCYVMNDVKEGTLIAYLINADDKNIQKPISRILIKPFINEEDPDDIFLVSEETQYGTSDSKFGKIVDQWVDNINGPDKSGLYCINPKLYKDSDKDTAMVGGYDLRGMYKKEGMSDKVIRLLRRLLASKGIDNDVDYIPETKEFQLYKWRDFDRFLRDIYDRQVEKILEIAQGDADWQVDATSISDFASIIQELPDKWQEKFMNHTHANNIKDAAKVLINNNDPWYESFVDVVKGEHKIREQAWERLAEYCDIGWYFTCGGGVNIPTDVEKLKDFVTSNQSVTLTISIDQMFDIATYDDDGDYNEVDVYNLRQNGWDAISDNERNNMIERRYENDLTDGADDDTWLYDLENDPNTLFVEPYLVRLNGHSQSRIEDPRQSELLESMKRLLKLSGL